MMDTYYVWTFHVHISLLAVTDFMYKNTVSGCGEVLDLQAAGKSEA